MGSVTTHPRGPVGDVLLHGLLQAVRFGNAWWPRHDVWANAVNPSTARTLWWRYPEGSVFKPPAGLRGVVDARDRVSAQSSSARASRRRQTACWPASCIPWPRRRSPACRGQPAWVLDVLGLRPSDSLLEIGPGPGVGVELAATRAPRGRVVGVDASETMLARARRRNRHRSSWVAWSSDSGPSTTCRSTMTRSTPAWRSTASTCGRIRCAA
jgi:Methyltransferase domain